MLMALIRVIEQAFEMHSSKLERESTVKVILSMGFSKHVTDSNMIEY